MTAPEPLLPTPTDRELVVSRIITAPRERVFAAWTDRLAEWWGPHGMTTQVVELNLCAGGAFRTVMRAPDGREYRTRGIFLEVSTPERIVFTDAFDPGWQPHADIFFTAVATFADLPRRHTRCTAWARHWTPAARQQHARMGFQQCWGESLDRLATLVSAR